MLLFVTSMIMPSMMWAQSITLTKPNGEGTAESPYQISNAEELYWFAGLVNGDASVCDYNEETNPTGVKQNTAACATLMNNIVVNKNVLNTNGEPNSDTFTQWTPIGNSYQNRYTGKFDGDNHTVSGLYFNNTNAEMVGLFGYVESGGKISNVGVVDSYFNFKMLGGGICGNNRGEIKNCTNSGTVYGSNDYNNVGGVCGFNVGSIEKCYNLGTVSGSMYVGGVCGANKNQATIGTITNCFNAGIVNGNNVAGGVCGMSEGTITNCFNAGNVKANMSVVGGVCGDKGFNATAIITNCYYLRGTAKGGIYGKDESGSAEPMFLEQFESGEVAYLLAEGNVFGEQSWGQLLGTDQYPVLGSDYKVIKAAQGDKDASGNDTYWATFSNLTNDVTLSVPSGRTLRVYNAKVSNGTMTLTQRNDNQVAMEEGVLLKSDGEYVNAKANETNGLTKASSDDNLLVATPAEPKTITAESGYKLYRLTYNNATTKVGLGFYLSVDKDNTSAANGTSLKATPGKAYLQVSEDAAKDPSSAALARSFVFGSDNETTGIEGITIMGTDLQHHNTHEGIFDLQGRKISTPTKGIYIKNNKKVIIK